jgi:hypothetical protein
MAEPVSLQTLLTYLTLISIPIGVLYHIMTLRNTRKNQELQLETRQTQLFMNVYNNHISLPTHTITIELLHQWTWEDYDDFMTKYSLPNNLEANVKWSHYFASLEGLGILIKKGVIDPDLVYSSQYGSIITIWEKFLPIIEEWRKRTDSPHLYEDPEYLYNEMIRMRNERGHSPTITRIRDLTSNNP